jgi:hypothetical protein
MPPVAPLPLPSYVKRVPHGLCQNGVLVAMIGRGGVGDGDFDDLVGADMAQGTKISPMTNEPAAKNKNK